MKTRVAYLYKAYEPPDEMVISFLFPQKWYKKWFNGIQRTVSFSIEGAIRSHINFHKNNWLSKMIWKEDKTFDIFKRRVRITGSHIEALTLWENIENRNVESFFAEMKIDLENVEP
jgi:hypothetical protein